MTVYKGGMPAQYGGRLSSVVDIKMNDGNNQDYNVSGGVGLISSKLNVEGPLQKNRSSFLISGRRTYADLFAKLSSDSAIRSNTIYFYDLNAKLNYQLNDKNRLYLSGYFGKDVIGIGETFGINWGNGTGTLRWNHIFNNRLFSNTSLIFSNYKYNIDLTSITENDMLMKSKIRDLSLKEDLQYYVSNNGKINFGFQVTRHMISPAVLACHPRFQLQSIKMQNNYSFENAVYVSHELSGRTNSGSIMDCVYPPLLLPGRGIFIPMTLREIPYTRQPMEADKS